MSEGEEVVGGMNTNRHAAQLSDFFEVCQATLNRNAHKGPIEEMSLGEIQQKLFEEWHELQDELDLWPLHFADERDPRAIEREAADLAVCALAAFVWARGQGCS